jgi:hypothetical protein
MKEDILYSPIRKNKEKQQHDFFGYGTNPKRICANCGIDLADYIIFNIPCKSKEKDTCN